MYINCIYNLYTNYIQFGAVMLRWARWGRCPTFIRRIGCLRRKYVFCVNLENYRRQSGSDALGRMSVTPELPRSRT